MNIREGCQQRRNEWLERNAQPKNRYIVPSVKNPPTRWQKPGPMNRADWVYFHKWILRQYYPSHEQKQQQSDPIAKKLPALMQPIPGVFIWRQPRNLGGNKAHKEAIKRLSKPRNPRRNYVAPSKNIFTYRPWIGNGPPPRLERGRPRKTPKIPLWFQHDELEIDFWSKLRFPVSRGAKRAVASKRWINLSLPRCSLPKPIERPPKRQKMSPRQWRSHQRRLSYLSLPNPRVLAELCCTSFRNLCPQCGCPLCCPFSNLMN